MEGCLNVLGRNARYERLWWLNVGFGFLFIIGLTIEYVMAWASLLNHYYAMGAIVGVTWLPIAIVGIGVVTYFERQIATVKSESWRPKISQVIAAYRKASVRLSTSNPPYVSGVFPLTLTQEVCVRGKKTKGILRVRTSDDSIITLGDWVLDEDTEEARLFAFELVNVLNEYLLTAYSYTLNAIMKMRGEGIKIGEMFWVPETGLLSFSVTDKELMDVIYVDLISLEVDAGLEMKRHILLNRLKHSKKGIDRAAWWKNFGVAVDEGKK